MRAELHKSGEIDLCVGIPLVIDLDGTLTPVDTLHEAAIQIIKREPLWALSRLPTWMRAGKAQIKAEIAVRSTVCADTLPLNDAVLALIVSARQIGRRVVLCTASDQHTAAGIAERLSIFEAVIASDGVHNLAGKAKATALVEAFGENGFDYVGNSSADLHVWEKARRAIVVTNDTSLVDRARTVAEVETVIVAPKAKFDDWRKQLRLHQWAKNLLILVPVVASQQFNDLSIVLELMAAFIVFGIVASTTYVLNDILDIEADRAHAHKRFRPIAAGTVPVLSATLLIPVGLVAGLILAYAIGSDFLLATVAYLVGTIVYSFYVKRLVLLDCLFLAGLFTLRIVAGAAVIETSISYWLLLFSIFLFSSLAYLKRYIELREKRRNQKVPGRGYNYEDLPVVFALGIGAGYTAVVVLALYLFSPQAILLYGNSYVIAGVVPLLIYWLSYMWLTANRGKMHHDPVLYAINDRTSLIAVLIFFAIFFLGAALPEFAQ